MWGLLLEPGHRRVRISSSLGVCADYPLNGKRRASRPQNTGKHDIFDRWKSLYPSQNAPESGSRSRPLILPTSANRDMFNPRAKMEPQYERTCHRRRTRGCSHRYPTRDNTSLPACHGFWRTPEMIPTEALIDAVNYLLERGATCEMTAKA